MIKLKLLTFWSTLTGLFALGLLFASPAQAALCSPTYPQQISLDSYAEIRVDLSNASNPTSCLDNPNRVRCYKIVACNTGMSGTFGCLTNSFFDVPNQTLVGNTLVAGENRSSGLTFKILNWDPTRPITEEWQNSCGTQEWRVAIGEGESPGEAYCTADAFQIVGVRGGEEITNYTFEDQLRIKFNGNETGNFTTGGLFPLYLKGNGIDRRVTDLASVIEGLNRLHLNGSLVNSLNIGTLSPGTYELVVTDANILGRFPYCRLSFPVTEDGNNEPPEVVKSNFSLCDQITLASGQSAESSPSRTACRSCENGGGIWTAVGCIPTTAEGIVGNAIRIGLGIAGGVALVMILAAGFLFSTSQGDPKRTTEARELITSAIIGLLFIIFSVSILQFFGVSILAVPGFGGS